MRGLFRHPAWVYCNCRLSRSSLALALTLLFVSCDAPEGRVEVALITDAVPGVEFHFVELDLLTHDASAPRLVRSARVQVGTGDSFAMARTLTRFLPVAPGSYSLDARLTARDGVRPVLSRHLDVEVQEDMRIVVRLDRACITVECPGSSDLGSTECVGGRCEDPTCASSPLTCPTRTGCTTSADCPSTSTCAAPECVEGVCFAFPNPGACPEWLYCDLARGCIPYSSDVCGTPCTLGECSVGRWSCTMDGEMTCEPFLMRTPGEPCSDGVCDGRGACGAGTESCVPSRRGIPVDEDRDGRFDEGCPFYIGAIHPVLEAMPVDDDVLGGVRYVGADLTNDATRLFTTPVVDGSSRNQILVFHRSSPGEPFTAETQLVLPESPSAVSATEDGTQVFVEIGNSVRVQAYSWTGGAPALTAAFESFGQPSVRRDGAELFLTRSGAIYTSRLDSLGAWSTPEVVRAGRFPILSEDGLTLYFSDAGALQTLQRASLDARFGGASARPDFARIPSGQIVRPFHVVHTRELFFSLQTVGGLVVPTAGPTRAALFRAEVCRDAPCTPHALPCDGTRSEDGLHCYRGTRVTAYDAAITECAGAHLVSIHSADELRLIATTFPNAWLGARGRRWQSGEPFLFSLASVILLDDTCLVPTGTAWRQELCTNLHQAVCETELWPTFTN